MKRFLLQMAGASGGGKSTLARAIGRATGAVVLDKDVIKAPLLDGGRFPGALPLPEEVAAPHSYAVFFALSESLLGMGWSVVMDSPASFTAIREMGARMAAAAGADYYIVECCTPDIEELQRRLDNRVRVSSQPTIARLDGFVRPGTSTLLEPHLSIDTRQPIEASLRKALEYIGHDTG